MPEMKCSKMNLKSTTSEEVAAQKYELKSMLLKKHSENEQQQKTILRLKESNLQLNNIIKEQHINIYEQLNEKEVLQDTIRKLKESKITLECALKEQKAYKDELKAIASKLKEKKEQLQKNVQDLWTENSQLHTSVTDKSSQLALLEIQKKHLYHKITDLQRWNTKLKVAISEGDKQKDALKDIILNMKGANAKLKYKIVKLMEEKNLIEMKSLVLENVRQELKATKIQKKSLVFRTSETEESNIQVLTTKVKLEEKNNKMKGTIKELKDKIQKMEAAALNFEHLRHKLDSAEMQKKELTFKSLEMQKANSQLLAANRKLEEEKTKLKITIEEIQGENQQMKASLIDLEKLRYDSKEIATQNWRLALENSAIQEANTYLQAAKVKLEKENNQMKGTIMKLQDKNYTLEAGITELNNLKHEIETTETQNKDFILNNTQLQKTKTQSLAAKGYLEETNEEECTVKEHQIKTHQEEAFGTNLEMFKHEQWALETKKEELKTVEMQKENMQLMTAKDKLEKENDKMKGTIRELQDKSYQLEAYVTELRSEIKTLQSERTFMVKDSEEYEAEKENNAVNSEAKVIQDRSHQRDIFVTQLKKTFLQPNNREAQYKAEGSQENETNNYLQTTSSNRNLPAPSEGEMHLNISHKEQQNSMSEGKTSELQKKKTFLEDETNESCITLDIIQIIETYIDAENRKLKSNMLEFQKKNPQLELFNFNLHEKNIQKEVTRSKNKSLLTSDVKLVNESSKLQANAYCIKDTAEKTEESKMLQDCGLKISEGKNKKTEHKSLEIIAHDVHLQENKDYLQTQQPDLQSIKEDTKQLPKSCASRLQEYANEIVAKEPKNKNILPNMLKALQNNAEMHNTITSLNTATRKVEQKHNMLPGDSLKNSQLGTTVFDARDITYSHQIQTQNIQNTEPEKKKQLDTSDSQLQDNTNNIIAFHSQHNHSTTTTTTNNNNNHNNVLEELEKIGYLHDIVPKQTAALGKVNEENKEPQKHGLQCVKINTEQLQYKTLQLEATVFNLHHSNDNLQKQAQDWQNDKQENYILTSKIREVQGSKAKQLIEQCEEKFKNLETSIADLKCVITEEQKESQNLKDQLTTQTLLAINQTMELQGLLSEMLMDNSDLQEPVKILQTENNKLRSQITVSEVNEDVLKQNESNKKSDKNTKGTLIIAEKPFVEIKKNEMKAEMYISKLQRNTHLKNNDQQVGSEELLLKIQQLPASYEKVVNENRLLKAMVSELKVKLAQSSHKVEEQLIQNEKKSENSSVKSINYQVLTNNQIQSPKQSEIRSEEKEVPEKLVYQLEKRLLEEQFELCSLRLQIESQRKEFDTEKSKLENKIVELNSNIELLNKNVKNCEKEIKSMEITASEQEKMLSEEQMYSSKMRSKMNQLIHAAEEEKGQLELMMDELLQENTRLQHIINDHEERATVKVRETEEKMKTTKVQGEEKLNEKHFELMVPVSDIAKLQEIINVLQNRNNKLQETIEVYGADKALLEEALIHVDDELAEARSHFQKQERTLQIKLNAAKEMIRKLQSENDKLVNNELQLQRNLTKLGEQRLLLLDMIPCKKGYSVNEIKSHEPDNSGEIIKNVDEDNVTEAEYSVFDTKEQYCEISKQPTDADIDFNMLQDQALVLAEMLLEPQVEFRNQNIQLARMEHTKESLQQSVRELSDTNNKLQSEIKKLKEERSVLELNIIDLKIRLKDEHGSVSASETKLQEIEGEKIYLEKMVAELLNDNTKFQDKIDSLEEKVSVVSAQYLGKVYNLTHGGMDTKSHKTDGINVNEMEGMQENICIIQEIDINLEVRNSKLDEAENLEGTVTELGKTVSQKHLLNENAGTHQSNSGFKNIFSLHGKEEGKWACRDTVKDKNKETSIRESKNKSNLVADISDSQVQVDSKTELWLKDKTKAGDKKHFSNSVDKCNVLPSHTSDRKYSGNSELVFNLIDVGLQLQEDCKHFQPMLPHVTQFADEQVKKMKGSNEKLHGNITELQVKKKCLEKTTYTPQIISIGRNPNASLSFSASRVLDQNIKLQKTANSLQRRKPLLELGLCDCDNQVKATDQKNICLYEQLTVKIIDEDRHHNNTILQHEDTQTDTQQELDSFIGMQEELKGSAAPDDQTKVGNVGTEEVKELQEENKRLKHDIQQHKEQSTFFQNTVSSLNEKLSEHINCSKVEENFINEKKITEQQNVLLQNTVNMLQKDNKKLVESQVTFENDNHLLNERISKLCQMLNENRQFSKREYESDQEEKKHEDMSKLETMFLKHKIFAEQHNQIDLRVLNTANEPQETIQPFPDGSEDLQARVLELQEIANDLQEKCLLELELCKHDNRVMVEDQKDSSLQEKCKDYQDSNNELQNNISYLDKGTSEDTYKDKSKNSKMAETMKLLQVSNEKSILTIQNLEKEKQLLKETVLDLINKLCNEHKLFSCTESQTNNTEDQKAYSKQGIEELLQNNAYLNAIIFEENIGKNSMIYHQYEETDVQEMNNYRKLQDKLKEKVTLNSHTKAEITGVEEIKELQEKNYKLRINNHELKEQTTFLENMVRSLKEKLDKQINYNKNEERLIRVKNCFLKRAVEMLQENNEKLGQSLTNVDKDKHLLSARVSELQQKLTEFQHFNANITVKQVHGKSVPYKYKMFEKEIKDQGSLFSEFKISPDKEQSSESIDVNVKMINTNIELQETVQTLKSANEDLQVKALELQETVNNLNEKKNHLESELRNLGNQLKVSDQNNTCLQEKCKHYSTRNLELQKSVGDISETITKEMSKNASLIETVKLLQMKNEESKLTIEELEKEKNILKDTVAELQQMQSSEHKPPIDKTNHNEDEKVFLKSGIKENNVSIHQHLHEESKQSDGQQELNNCTELQDKLKGINTLDDKTKVEVKEANKIKGLQEENKNLQIVIQKLKQQNAFFENQVFTLQEKLEKQTNYNKDEDSLINQKRITEEKNSLLQKAVTILQDNNEKLLESHIILEKDNSLLNARISELQQKLNEMCEKQAFGEKEQNKKENPEKKKKNLESVVSDTKLFLDQDQYNENEYMDLKLANTCNKPRSGNEDLQIKILELQEIVNDLQEKKYILEIELCNLDSQLKAAVQKDDCLAKKSIDCERKIMEPYTSVSDLNKGTSETISKEKFKNATTTETIELLQISNEKSKQTLEELEREKKLLKDIVSDRQLKHCGEHMLSSNGETQHNNIENEKAFLKKRTRELLQSNVELIANISEEDMDNVNRIHQYEEGTYTDNQHELHSCTDLQDKLKEKYLPGKQHVGENTEVKETKNLQDEIKKLKSNNQELKEQMTFFENLAFSLKAKLDQQINNKNEESLSNEKNIMQQKNDFLQKAVTMLQENNQKFLESHIILERDNQLLTARISELQKRLRDSQHFERIIGKNHIVDKNNQNKKINLEEENKNVETQSFINGNEDLQANILELQETVQSLKEQKHLLELQFYNSDSQLNASNQKDGCLQKNCKDYEDSIMELQRSIVDLKKSTNETISKEKSKSTRMTEIIKLLQISNEKSQLTIEVLEKEKKKTKDTISDLQDKVGDEQKLYGNTEGRSNSTEDTRSSVKRRIKEPCSHVQSNADSIATISEDTTNNVLSHQCEEVIQADHQHQLDNCRELQDDLKEKAAKDSQTKLDIAGTPEIKELQQENMKLKINVQELKEQKTIFENVICTLKEKLEKQKNYDRDEESLTNKKKTEEKMYLLHKAVKILQENNERLVESHSILERENYVLKAKISELQQKPTELQHLYINDKQVNGKKGQCKKKILEEEKNILEVIASELKMSPGEIQHIENNKVEFKLGNTDKEYEENVNVLTNENEDLQAEISELLTQLAKNEDVMNNSPNHSEKNIDSQKSYQQKVVLTITERVKSLQGSLKVLEEENRLLKSTILDLQTNLIEEQWKSYQAIRSSSFQQLGEPSENAEETRKCAEAFSKWWSYDVKEMEIIVCKEKLEVKEQNKQEDQSPETVTTQLMSQGCSEERAIKISAAVKSFFKETSICLEELFTLCDITNQLTEGKDVDFHRLLGTADTENPTELAVWEEKLAAGTSIEELKQKISYLRTNICEICAGDIGEQCTIQ
nr:PREDICTED: protein PFC0760c-like isoform X1 [Latimeria chalumnae]|eukprot:XP_014345946.1 PREDICTED: protein PFC0760c-like isoform X1 [Latimeria chalumnae]